MSLQTQLTTAFTRVGTEFKTVRATLGSNANLTTTAKDTLVNAINEVKAATTNAGAQINDTTPSGTTVYSSNKTQSVANAAALALINDSAAVGSTSQTYSVSKTISVANAAASAASAALINDTTASGTTVYSANKTNAAITAAITGLINGAPAAYDTLKEIADYIASDTSNASAMTASINGRIDTNAAQTYSAGQLTQGLANLVTLGVAKQSDLSTLTTNVGDTTRDFSGDFTAALV